MSDSLRFSGQPQLRSPCLVVGWGGDAGKLGAKVIDYMNKKLGGQSFGEIEPAEFFSLSGVTILDDLVQFPESKFYACPENDLVVFEGVPPNYEWYRFLSLILDAAEHHCHVKEIYTVGGLVSLSAHTAPRELIGVFNSPELKESLGNYNVAAGLDYETPPGQRPTISSFLLWAAGKRNIPGVNLWVPIPFYLISGDDPRAQRRVLQFFDQRFQLQIDFTDLDEEIGRQEQIIADMRNSFPDIDAAIEKLESNIMLNEAESQRLVQETERFLRQKRG